MKDLPVLVLDKKPRIPYRFFVRWYQQHGRSFPWRLPDTTAFGVLVAEVLLRQTRAETVAPIWMALVQTYPTPRELGGASSADLASLVRPLGLGHQRAEALADLGRTISRDWHGRVPRSIAALETLPHVGVYSAHAVASFAFRQRVAVVDGNVLRVLSRIYGVDLGKDNRRSPLAWELAENILPQRNVREHNLGLLDFSAQVCVSRNPRHDECPLGPRCHAFITMSHPVM